MLPGMAEYQVLARKYRSETFDEVVGQEPVVRTLVNAIRENKIHHAYLFTGTRGVGKTTLARILAKALNCLSADAPTPEPCCTCDACVSIARGDDVDVVEIDGASNRGIDDIRELRANAIYRPARCRYKVYYIDEVHQVTRDAFNALLKTLEEPPEHVKFIFATTEPEKIPPTILSRCQRFDFRNIPTAEIADHLKTLCKSEKVKADDDALFRIARAAAGSMRDGLSLLDQLLAGAEKVTDDEVVRVLGTPGDERTFALVAAIAEQRTADALGELAGVLESGVTLASLVGAMSDAYRNMMIVATCGGESDLIELPETQRKQLADLAGKFTLPALVHGVGLCQRTAQTVRGSSVARALVEAAIVRLAEAEKFIDAESLAERLEQLAAGGAPQNAGQKKKPAPDPLTPASRPSVGQAKPPQPSPAPSANGAQPAPLAPPPEQFTADAPAIDDPPAETGAPSYVPPAKPISTEEREDVEADPVVVTVKTLFDGDLVDLRREPPDPAVIPPESSDDPVETEE
jgi:DNA polymerase III subunit gamma/tau